VFDYTILASMPDKRRVKRRRGRDMTTTVTLPVELMKRAKIAAIQRQTSFKALVEQGLRVVLARKEAT
jgi:ribosomal protein L1